MKKIGLVAFEEMEVLDFAGPFEVFSLCEDASGHKACAVEVVGWGTSPVRARNGLNVVPHRPAASTDRFDVLIVPGGWGAEKIVIEDSAFIRWLQETSARSEVTASICTGAFLLAKAGLLKGKRATTHHLDYQEFRERWPETQLQEGIRWVDEGNTLTSGGISAGIDLSLHLVERLVGRESARRTAARMEYRWEENP